MTRTNLLVYILFQAPALMLWAVVGNAYRYGHALADFSIALDEAINAHEARLSRG